MSERHQPFPNLDFGKGSDASQAFGTWMLGHSDFVLAVILECEVEPAWTRPSGNRPSPPPQEWRLTYFEGWFS